MSARDDERLADVVAERDKAREECGYEKRMRAAQREELLQFVRLKKERDETIARVRALCDQWSSATEVEPGVAHCVRHLRAALDGP